MAQAYAHQPGQRIAVRDSNNSAFEGRATGTDIYSAAVNPKGANRVGFFIDVDSSTGTTPTLDITFQISFDKGTSWANLPATANSQTQAALTQIGDTVGTWYEYYDICADPEFTRIRAHFNFGGSTPMYTFGPVYWIFDYVSKG